MSLKDPVFGSSVVAGHPIRLPLFTGTYGLHVVAPVIDGLFVVAQEVDHRGMLDKNGFEGWWVARNMMFKGCSIPRPKETT